MNNILSQPVSPLIPLTRDGLAAQKRFRSPLTVSTHKNLTEPTPPPSKLWRLVTRTDKWLSTHNQLSTIQPTWVKSCQLSTIRPTWVKGYQLSTIQVQKWPVWLSFQSMLDDLWPLAYMTYELWNCWPVWPMTNVVAGLYG